MAKTAQRGGQMTTSFYDPDSKKPMTKAQAIKQFKSLYEAWGCSDDDVIAKRTYWNDYTDLLCKNGQITFKQYENWGQPF